MTTINFDGKCFNYQVDVGQGRIWLEDDVSKQQWQWLSDEPFKSRPVHDGKQVPERVFLAAVKSLFDEGPVAKPGRVQLGEGADGKLTLDVEVSLTFSDWCAKESLVLDLIPLEEIDLVRARLTDVQTKLAKVESLVAAQTKRSDKLASQKTMRVQRSEMESSLNALRDELSLMKRELVATQNIHACAIQNRVKVENFWIAICSAFIAWLILLFKITDERKAE